MVQIRHGLAKAVGEVLGRHGSKAKPLSLREAARLTGLSPATVGELAKGNARTADAIRRFADGFGEEATRLLLLGGFLPEEPVPVLLEILEDELSLDEKELFERLKKGLLKLPEGEERKVWKRNLWQMVELLEWYGERATDRI